MEFPKLGENCSNASCKQLDFLPMKCDACSKIFCKDHIQYVSHSCSESYKKDSQVPICPLCDKPIPISPGELPDIKVGQHIDSACQSDPAKERRKVYTNKCSFKKCKQKEMMSVNCPKCKLNYCLKHRHESDHNCQGFMGSGRAVSNAAAAAIQRHSANVSSNKTDAFSAVRNAQNNMTDDEALNRAVQQSLSDGRSTGQRQQEEDDARFARALLEQDRMGQRQRRSNNHRESCRLL